MSQSYQVATYLFNIILELDIKDNKYRFLGVAFLIHKTSKSNHSTSDKMLSERSNSLGTNLYSSYSALLAIFHYNNASCLSLLPDVEYMLFFFITLLSS